MQCSDLNYRVENWRHIGGGDGAPKWDKFTQCLEKTERLFFVGIGANVPLTEWPKRL